MREQSLIKKSINESDTLLYFFNPEQQDAYTDIEAELANFSEIEVPRFLIATHRDVDSSYPFESMKHLQEKFNSWHQISTKNKNEVNNILKHIVTSLIDP